MRLNLYSSISWFRAHGALGVVAMHGVVRCWDARLELKLSYATNQAVPSDVSWYYYPPRYVGSLLFRTEL